MANILEKINEVNTESFKKQKELRVNRANAIMQERVQNKHTRRNVAGLPERISGLAKIGSGGKSSIKRRSKGLDIASLLSGK